VDFSLGNRRSLLVPGQVSRMAEEAQLCSCWPKSHESVTMYEQAHCQDGGTRSCFSATDVFFSWHFLLDVSALCNNTSDSLFDPDVRIYDAQHPWCKKKTVNMTCTFDLTCCTFFGLGEYFPTHCEDCIFVSISYP
jgi:hypothetical protein